MGALGPGNTILLDGWGAEEGGALGAILLPGPNARPRSCQGRGGGHWRPCWDRTRETEPHTRSCSPRTPGWACPWVGSEGGSRSAPALGPWPPVGRTPCPPQAPTPCPELVAPLGRPGLAGQGSPCGPGLRGLLGAAAPPPPGADPPQMGPAWHCGLRAHTCSSPGHSGSLPTSAP